MKQRLIMIMALAVFTALAFWWLLPEPQHRVRVQASPIEKPQAVANKLKTEPEMRNAEPTKTESGLITSAIQAFESAALVSRAYAAELKYPKYSQPLTERDVDRLEPNYFNPQSILVDDNGAEISAVLSKFRYLYPEPIEATLFGEGIDSAELHLTHVVSKEKVSSTPFRFKEGGWRASLSGSERFPPQLMATVQANVAGKTIPIALSLKYLNSVASLESFETAVADDADMVVKANMTTQKAGLYRVRANLFDSDRKPIAHLVSKKKLPFGSTNIELKAHQSVLVGKAAPFYLGTFVIELMSPKPGVPTEYGHSEIKEHEIRDFMITSLSSTPYQASEQELQRLELLQSMSGG